ncbi:MAG: XdhC family protein, partial [Planctomycetota bacterium]
MALLHHQRAAQLIDAATPFVTVTLIKADGSVPQDVGASIIVTRDGLDHGTVGGGRVETAALKHAAEMLKGDQRNELLEWNLNLDLGMTCGGRVTFFFQRVDTAAWPIVVFGAGHVAQALTRLLTTLPCQVTCVDSRPEWVERLP